MLAAFAVIAVRVIPFELAVMLTSLFLRLFLLVSPKARQQLRKASKELAQGEFSASEYIKRSAFNIALMAKMGSSFSRRIRERATIEGEEYIKRLHEKGESAVVTTFHFGPWELIAETFLARGYKVTALVGHQSMTFVEGVLRALRKRSGLLTFQRQRLKQALKELKKGSFLAVLLDKTRRGKGGCWGLPFHDYNVSVIPERIAKQVDKHLLPFICRFKRGRLTITIGPPDQNPRDFFSPYFKESPLDWLVWGE